MRGIIFDLFHTLVDPEDFKPKDFRRGEVAAGLLGLDKSKFSVFWESNWKLRMSSPRPEIEYLKDFAADSGRTVSSSALDEAESVLRRYQDIAILNPRDEVVASLKMLKDEGYKLGLLSNTFQGDVREWPRSALAPYFDAVAFSHETGIMKPDPKAYHNVLERLGIDSSRCMFVGDGGSEELMGAKRAGFGQVVFMKRFVSTNGIRSKEELEELAKQADFSVDSLEELCERAISLH